MSVCVLTIRDGRDDVHEESLATLIQQSPEPEYHVSIDDRSHELGFAGAIAKGWREVLATGTDYVFHHEADFIFNQPVPIEQMIGLLEAQPHLVQVALKRQPCNAEEAAAGGIVELHPDDFRERHHGDYVWTEHRRFFTTNPSVYPAALCARGWPQVKHSEGIFSHRLFNGDPEAHSCFWGAKWDEPMVEHVGVRVGHGY